MAKLDPVAPPLAVPVLRAGRWAPELLAPFALSLVLADMVLRPWTTITGLRDVTHAAWRPTAVSLGMMAVAGTVPVVLVARASKARSTLRAALWCALAGLSFGLVSGVVGYAWLSWVAPMGRNALTNLWFFTRAALVTQGATFPVALAALVLPAVRGGATLDRGHWAALVVGTWLLALGTLVRWGTLGGSVSVRLELSPLNWSLALVAPGLALLAASTLADRRLLAWLGAVRRGERTGWRVVPRPDGSSERAIPASSGASTTDLDAVIEGPDGAVAAVFGDGDGDGKRLRRQRNGAVAAVLGALVLLVAMVLITIMFLARGFW